MGDFTRGTITDYDDPETGATLPFLPVVVNEETGQTSGLVFQTDGSTRYITLDPDPEPTEEEKADALNTEERDELARLRAAQSARDAENKPNPAAAPSEPTTAHFSGPAAQDTAANGDDENGVTQ